MIGRVSTQKKQFLFAECVKIYAFFGRTEWTQNLRLGPKQISRTGMVSSKNKCSLLHIILEMSGSLTASTVLSAYQRAAVATQQKTNAVTIFFQVLFN